MIALCIATHLLNPMLDTLLEKIVQYESSIHSYSPADSHARILATHLRTPLLGTPLEKVGQYESSIHSYSPADSHAGHPPGDGWVV